MTDSTEHPTREGKVDCWVVLEVCSGRVVGWSIDSHQATPLVTGALGMAIHNRNPGPEQTVIQSDHGSQPRFKGVHPARQSIRAAALDGHRRRRLRQRRHRVLLGPMQTELLDCRR